MSHKKLTALIVSFIVILVVLWSMRPQDPHDFEGKCYICHVGEKDPSILTRDVDRLCLFCHPDNGNRSHPSDVMPGKELPAQFPIIRGKMVCVTCHFPHRTYEEGEGLIGRTEMGPFLLRAETDGKMFCYQCHKGNFVNFKVDSHALSVKMAHSATLSYELKDSVDDNSRECLSCHDGTLSIESGTQVRDVNWEHSRGIGLSHPISVDYAEAYFRKPLTFHPPQALDSRIILINGNIGCATCHDHYSERKGKLVMDNFRSRLCLSCHNL
ncbi:MAG: hypothetical protein JXB23_08515 [Candidatus Aminicenantes bacterium]|nr:hypothetical protein [Candidatus Aminicenantes bacterium]